VSGGKGKIIEFFGPGTETLSATAMATASDWFYHAVRNADG